MVPRTGYLVEFNALWYNALMFAQDLFEEVEEEKLFITNLKGISNKAKPAFVEMFLNDYGYLYDYVDGSYADPSVRPNMIIAAGLDYSPLDRRQRKRLLDVVTRELLTPKGLRTLSPKSWGYKPWYLGNPEEREVAYYAGSARPWLMHIFYLYFLHRRQSYEKVSKTPNYKRKKRLCHNRMPVLT